MSIFSFLFIGFIALFGLDAKGIENTWTHDFSSPHANPAPPVPPVTPVPEPVTMAVLGVGAAGLLRRRSR